MGVGTMYVCMRYSNQNESYPSIVYEATRVYYYILPLFECGKLQRGDDLALKVMLQGSVTSC